MAGRRHFSPWNSDRLGHDSAERVRLHLCTALVYKEKLVRFIENHDEPRAAVTPT